MPAGGPPAGGCAHETKIGLQAFPDLGDERGAPADRGCGDPDPRAARRVPGRRTAVLGDRVTMRITLFGTRGSIPAPGPETARFGGNTPSVEVRGDDGTVLVLDAGT